VDARAKRLRPTPGSGALTLSTAEFELVTSLGPLLGDTPRRVKRFVNTVQFPDASGR
jgi:hypothetical protein